MGGSMCAEQARGLPSARARPLLLARAGGEAASKASEGYDERWGGAA